MAVKATIAIDYPTPLHARDLDHVKLRVHFEAMQGPGKEMSWAFGLHFELGRLFVKGARSGMSEMRIHPTCEAVTEVMSAAVRSASLGVRISLDV